ncbi:MAG: leucine-rich repeat domain-containing protein, partial [Ruminococcus sp.]|nr:leucine-rich repeat domain-containing protein [Ruminococcus sp.]
DSINYIIYSNGTILLRGTGEMYNYDNENPSPFYDNKNLKTLMVSDNITSIGKYAFRNCENLTSVSLPTNLKTLGSGCFWYKYENLGEVNGLTSIAIPNSVTEIEDGALWGSAITSLTIPPSVETVGRSVCQGCINLETVRYEGSIIGEHMFNLCAGLKNFTIAKTVTEISAFAFRNCSNLEIIIYEGSIEEWANITKGQSWEGRTYMNEDVSRLGKIQCTDGYMQFDSENKVWFEVRE